MNKYFIILWMIFFHIIGNYYLQGWLANAKQKSWWEKNAPDKLYKNDYLMALFMHGFSWTFMIMFPIAFYVNFNISLAFLAVFIWNIVFHCYIDNVKDNLKLINLVDGQLIYLSQIMITFLCLIY